MYYLPRLQERARSAPASLLLHRCHPPPPPSHHRPAAVLARAASRGHPSQTITTVATAAHTDTKTPLESTTARSGAPDTTVTMTASGAKATRTQIRFLTNALPAHFRSCVSFRMATASFLRERMPRSFLVT